MQENTIKRLQTLAMERTGYITTDELLKKGITNRQIASFVEHKMLEKISHGHYWLSCAGIDKPEDYKPLELCITNPRAIICADSACYYLGLIQKEPVKVSVATRRSDRSKVKVNFPTARHYFGDELFEEYSQKVTTPLGTYTIYGLERSVCDCIRFKNDIEETVFDLVIENYRKREDKQMERLFEYAKKVRMLKRVKNYL